MTSLKKKYIGDRAFYKMVVVLIIPIIVQQGITNFVNLLDNVMVGKLGTEQMSGVAITNQLIFVFNMIIFGGLAGASIFGAQFYGVKDHDGMRRTMRFKLIFAAVACALSISVFCLFGDGLVRLFLDNEANADLDIGVTLGYARDYLRIIVFGLVPFAIVQAYSGTLRECGETVVPMIASVCAILVNLTFNYLLIFGNFGFPKLGVAGAAIATVMSRYVELLVIVIYTHTRSARFLFIKGLYKSLYVSKELARRIIRTGSPLMFNEMLWSLGTTFINRNYSTRGLAVVAASNINTTAWMLFCVVMFAMGSAVSILVGQRLGANDIEGAKDVDNKLLFFTVASHIVIGLIIVAASPFIPLLYNTEPEVRSIATKFLIVAGASLPIHSFIHVAYFTIRSGGKTVVTFLFDCVYTWAVPAVLSLVLCRFTSLDIVAIYAIVQFSDMIKLFVAVALLRSGFWAQNIIRGAQSPEASE